MFVMTQVGDSVQDAGVGVGTANGLLRGRRLS